MAVICVTRSMQSVKPKQFVYAYRGMPVGSLRSGSRVCFAGYRLDLAGHGLIDASGAEIPLTGGEFRLLREFARKSACPRSSSRVAASLPTEPCYHAVTSRRHRVYCVYSCRGDCQALTPRRHMNGA